MKAGTTRAAQPMASDAHAIVQEELARAAEWGAETGLHQLPDEPFIRNLEARVAMRGNELSSECLVARTRLDAQHSTLREKWARAVAPPTSGAAHLDADAPAPLQVLPAITVVLGTGLVMSICLAVGLSMQSPARAALILSGAIAGLNTARPVWVRRAWLRWQRSRSERRHRRRLAQLAAHIAHVVEQRNDASAAEARWQQWRTDVVTAVRAEYTAQRVRGDGARQYREAVDPADSEVKKPTRGTHADTTVQ